VGGLQAAVHEYREVVGSCDVPSMPCSVSVDCANVCVCVGVCACVSLRACVCVREGCDV